MPIELPVRPPVGPSFLVGPTLYLRGLELHDAATATRWNPSPFPRPADLTEERLKDDVPDAAHRKEYRLIACRRSDDAPVGSVECSTQDGLCGWISLYVDPLTGARGRDIKAEMLRVIVPYLLEEREWMVAWVELPASDESVIQVARAIGMRKAVRFREAAWIAGAREDLFTYEALHPAWVAKLGMPESATEGPVERTAKWPAPLTWSGRDGNPPGNAFAVGNRIYLRPIEQVDAEEMARWTMHETESFYELGRRIGSPISFWNWNRKNAEGDPPTWIRFAIVTLESDIVIGSNGIDIDWISRIGETEIEISRPDFRGAGYGTEAKQLLLEYAFDRLGLHMVKSRVWAFNTRSYDALIKQGYRLAGRMAWTGVKHAEFVDDFTFDLLASEWRAQRAAGG